MKEQRKRAPRGLLTLRVLEALETLACGIDDLFYIAALPYGTPLGGALRELEKRQSRQKHWAHTTYQKLQERRRVYNALYHLKKDRLIEGSRMTGFSLTAKGKMLLKKLRRKKSSALPFVTYTAQKRSGWVIMVFDVPEEEREKRDWLRETLGSLGFTMLQKSVWIGQTKLPQQFIEDLISINLKQYVHIFTVNKLGSISSYLEG